MALSRKSSATGKTPSYDPPTKPKPVDISSAYRLTPILLYTGVDAPEQTLAEDISDYDKVNKWLEQEDAIVLGVGKLNFKLTKSFYLAFGCELTSFVMRVLAADHFVGLRKQQQHDLAHLERLIASHEFLVNSKTANEENSMTEQEYSDACVMLNNLKVANANLSIATGVTALNDDREFQTEYGTLKMHPRLAAMDLVCFLLAAYGQIVGPDPSAIEGYSLEPVDISDIEIYLNDKLFDFYAPGKSLFFDVLNAAHAYTYNTEDEITDADVNKAKEELEGKKSPSRTRGKPVVKPL